MEADLSEKENLKTNKNKLGNEEIEKNINIKS